MVNAAAAREPDDAGVAAVQNIVVEFAQPLGKIRPLHGVNNGPADLGAHIADMTERHKEAGFPSVRLHDCQWPNPNVVDVNCIFPLFHADADDPKNYLFAPTDRYLEPIVKNGCQIVYRLGVSIEHKTTFYTHPPEDYDKWAKICVNIIRHYNEGWAGGFHYNIKHFEIWNEPNIGPGMWTGTKEQYYDLYRVAATAIKAHDPSLKVGGPAINTVFGSHPSSFAALFLAYCRDRKVPLDFFTWHCYSDSLSGMIWGPARARQLLDEYGFQNTESYCTEWKAMLPKWEEMSWRKTQPKFPVRQSFDRNRNQEAAALVAATLMQWQDSRLDMAHYYTADNSPWGMFDEYGVPGKVFFAFRAFNQLLQTSNRVAVTGAPGCTLTYPASGDRCVRVADPPGGNTITICAGVADNRKTAALLLSNYRGKLRRLKIALKDLPLAGKVRVERYVVDEKREFERVEEGSLDAANPGWNVTLPPDTVCLLRLSSAGDR